MALLYPWATKEYLLWEMSIGQIILYHNMGYELKYPSKENGEKTLATKSHSELKALREQMMIDGLIERPEIVEKRLTEKYGDIK